MKLYKNLVNSVALTLQEIFQKNRYADKAIERIFKQNPQWGSRDRRFVAEGVYDIVRNFRLYSEVAESPGNYWFITGVWLVLKNIDIPEWPEFRHLNKERIRRAHSSLSSNQVVMQSYPDWLWELGTQELGEETWKREAIAMNDQAPVFLRANTLKTTPEKLAAELLKSGIATMPVANCTSGLELLKRENVFQNRLFKEGWFEVQDAGSQQISEFLKPGPGDLVIDTCAGAGGKSLHLAALMKNKGKVISLDVDSRKLEELKKRARRAGAFNIETRLIENDGVSALFGKADLLLLDVPCSGLGVLKRNPDAKWKLNPQVIEKTKRIQESILSGYSDMLKAGGTMVYSTCSILPSENRQQVDQFLARKPAFTLLAEKTLMPSSGTDGFYMARIKKTR